MTPKEILIEIHQLRDTNGAWSGKQEAKAVSLCEKALNHCERLQAANTEKDAEIEQLRVQLAGCSVAANGGTSDATRVHKGTYGWSPAYQDALNCALKLDAANAEIQRLRKLAYRLRFNLPTNAEIGPIVEDKDQ